MKNIYNISIEKGIFEGEKCWKAEVKQIPDLIDFGDTWDETLDLMIDSIQTYIGHSNFNIIVKWDLNEIFDNTNSSSL